MKESLEDQGFSPEESDAIRKLQDAYQSGEKREAAEPLSPDDPWYVHLFVEYPGLVTDFDELSHEPNESILDSNEKIIDLAKTLVQQVENEPKNIIHNNGKYESHYRNDKEEYINITIQDSLLEENKKLISVVRHSGFNKPDTYPYIEGVEYHLSTSGDFYVDEYERFSPYEGCKRNTIASSGVFASEDLLLNAIAKYEELTNLLDSCDPPIQKD